MFCGCPLSESAAAAILVICAILFGVCVCLAGCACKHQREVALPKPKAYSPEHRTPPAQNGSPDIRSLGSTGSGGGRERRPSRDVHGEHYHDRRDPDSKGRAAIAAVVDSHL